MDEHEHVWYFAYGSNMSPAVMARRGITPIDAIVVVVPSHMLVFDVFGVPYTEPSMAGVQPKPATYKGPSVHGVAYLLSPPDYARLRVSEGAGTGYREAVLNAETVVLPQSATTTNTNTGTNTGTNTANVASHLRRNTLTLRVTALMARSPFYPARLPSRRYMNLLIDGAVQSSLPQGYVRYLQTLPAYTPPKRLNWMRELFAIRMFLAFWHPILASVMRGVKARASGQDATADPPVWAASVINVLFRIMWLYHDTVHWILWRCDGGSA